MKKKIWMKKISCKDVVFLTIKYYQKLLIVSWTLHKTNTCCKKFSLQQHGALSTEIPSSTIFLNTFKSWQRYRHWWNSRIFIWYDFKYNVRLCCHKIVVEFSHFIKLSRWSRLYVTTHQHYIWFKIDKKNVNRDQKSDQRSRN